ncbi:fatty acyl-CoA reductase 1 [Linepithema humile]|uniref:fatty acyl-CoA reductase 1 n=1 Tax=Linepithema humile TaxID=83485 RepID=UPI000623225B|nr:PREDICTED: fatty acyl-CoA reductase 1 [Linepithema humile]
MQNTEDTFIPAFYANRSVFITGGSGFLGKCLIEKLLRSCIDIDKIFLLMRPKKGLSVNDRLKKILNNKLFDVLRSERPSSFDKIILVSGNVALEGLGLLDEDKKMLTEHVSIIFHVAASVRFDESLKDAIFNNTRSTRDVCILAKDMKKLVALVHVSSTYTQTDKPTVDEILYPSEIDWRQTIKIAESVDDYLLRIFTSKYLGMMPNTYTFTKRLAEQIISDFSETYKLPCVIIRPSIVISTAEEPVHGWIDNFNGPIGLLIGGAKGILRVVYIDPLVASDFIPVDVAIKLTIVTAFKRGIKTITEDNKIHVYNCSSYNVKPLNMQQLVDLGFRISKKIPLEGIIWTPHSTLTKNRFLYYLMVLFLHVLPALFIDTILKLCGTRPILLKLQRKVYVSNSALSYFLLNEWKFYNKKLLELFDNLSVENQKEFGYDYRNFNEVDYFRDGVIGAKLYLLKEDINHLEAAKLHRKRMDWLSNITTILFVIFFLLILYRRNTLSNVAEIFSFLR